MAKIAEMTQLSPTMLEGLIVKWLKKIGDSVGPGEILAEVETDKAVMEMESYDSGTLLAILAEEGKKIKVGLPIAIIGKSGEDIAKITEEAKAKLNAGSIGTPVAPAPQKNPETATRKEAQKPEVTVVAEQQPPSLKPPGTVSNGVSSNAPRTTGRLHASPLAKAMALEKGIDIHKVNGSGPEGRITKKDILDFVISPAAKVSSKKNPPVNEEKMIEITGMRQAIAKRLHDAKNNIPHFYLNLEFDAEPVVEMRKKINADLKALAEKKKETPSSISINDLIVKACSVSLQRVPAVNSSWRGTHILQHGRIDIGIAVSIDGGLITPYVRNADELSVLKIHEDVKSLAERARKRKLKPEEYSDGTFTISNLGMFGITSFSAIINEPEAALMAIGALVEKPIVKDGTIVAGKTITVTLSCDHRVVDGAVGASFLSEFKDIIEHPHWLMV
ncbi:MAG: 2-oxo acid dehydrogenase subunit E2 [Leptospira sp.]|nr:2-oxo acid dehydrogenase subunit E2 [Leptospira sp.]